MRSTLQTSTAEGGWRPEERKAKITSGRRDESDQKKARLTLKVRRWWQKLENPAGKEWGKIAENGAHSEKIWRDSAIKFIVGIAKREVIIDPLKKTT